MKRRVDNPPMNGLSGVREKLQGAMGRIRAGEPGAIHAKELAGILADLQQGAEWMKRAPEDPAEAAAFQQQVLQYRALLEQVAKILPAIEGRLLSERTRLQNAQRQLSAANAWAQTSKKIL